MSPTRITLALLVAVLGIATPASAAPPWVDRNDTLPRHDWAFDFGVGLVHTNENPQPFPRRELGGGMNFEFGVGVTERLEIGLRGGVRFDDTGRALHADEYGRLFDRQTFGTGTDVLANPEFRIRGNVARGEVVEVALEGRAYLPIEAGTKPGFMFGVPFAFHLGGIARLDLGVFIPVIFTDPQTFYAISVPFDAWFQITNRLWLGPMTGVRFNHQSNGDSTQDISLGFGLGYQFARILDFKTMLLFPHINNGPGNQVFGVGAGLQVRIE